MTLRPDAVPWKPGTGPNPHTLGPNTENNLNSNSTTDANDAAVRNAGNASRPSAQNNPTDAVASNHRGGAGGGQQGPTTEAKLFVGQIPYECNSERLRELFEAYGRVKAIHILQDGAGGGGGGGGGGRGGGGGKAAGGKGRAAFITYDNTDEADAAIFTLHNRYRMLTNRPIQVSYAKNSPNISPFGRQAAIEVANANHSNPMPV